jgi:signal transduction histidine kinase
VAIVDKSLRGIAPELERGQVELSAHLPPAVPVRADPQRLQQVFLNVLLNAVQALPAGGRIDVELTQNDGVARIQFTDNGAGIPAAVRGRLFEPFVTSKPHGSGLGLAVARRIVEEHGGAIELIDAPGGGTRVVIALPSA